jgi:hypothetical protein
MDEFSLLDQALEDLTVSNQARKDTGLADAFHDLDTRPLPPIPSDEVQIDDLDAMLDTVIAETSNSKATLKRPDLSAHMKKDVRIANDGKVTMKAFALTALSYTHTYTLHFATITRIWPRIVLLTLMKNLLNTRIVHKLYVEAQIQTKVLPNRILALLLLLLLLFQKLQQVRITMRFPFCVKFKFCFTGRAAAPWGEETFRGTPGNSGGPAIASVAAPTTGNCVCVRANFVLQLIIFLFVGSYLQPIGKEFDLANPPDEEKETRPLPIVNPHKPLVDLKVVTVDGHTEIIHANEYWTIQEVLWTMSTRLMVWQTSFFALSG